MISFGFRNLKLFFKDKSTVILSLLAEIIIMILYILFIRDNLLQRFPMIEDAELIMDSWMIAGILGITPLTAAMGAYGIMVNDKAGRIERDFTTSPMGSIKMINGYIFSASTAAIIMSLAVLMLSQIYLIFCYGEIAIRNRFPEIIFIILVNSICSSIMIMLPVSLLKSSNALSACCTIIGSLIGFLTGIYLPMGSLDETVRVLIKIFPISHTVVLLRKCFAETFIDHEMTENAAASFREYMGIDFLFNDEVMTSSASLHIVALAAAVSIILVYAKGSSS